MKGKLLLKRDGGYSGFMGNLMFQIASAYGIAKKNNLELLLADTGYFNKDFYSWFKGPFRTRSVEELAMIECEEISEPHFHYHDFQLDPNKSYNLTGYFQSEKYWKHCEAEVTDIFSPSIEAYQHMTRLWLSTFRGVQIYMDDQGVFTNVISIHVRRGDYLNLQEFHTTLPIGYYNKAAEKLATSESVFVVFSDDPTWCKDNFTHDVFRNRTFFSENNSASDDFFFQTICSDNIISSSSFSWWASYLNTNPNKRIIAPKKENWFGEARRDWNVNDLYRDEFIEI